MRSQSCSIHPTAPIHPPRTESKMRYELRRRLVTVARCLAELGETENARAIARRVHDGTAVEWLRGEHGEHAWSTSSPVRCAEAGT